VGLGDDTQQPPASLLMALMMVNVNDNSGARISMPLVRESIHPMAGPEGMRRMHKSIAYPLWQSLIILSAMPFCHFQQVNQHQW